MTGDGSLPGTQLGPIINARQLARIQRIVKESVAAGAQVDLGGSATGSVFQPTILTAVKTDTPCWQVWSSENCSTPSVELALHRRRYSGLWQLFGNLTQKKKVG